jgi:[acyl-carrier-protein] S-malonyltransferase
MCSDTTIFDPERKWASLFPGIGIRLFGKEPDFYRKYKSYLKPYLDMGSGLLGEDLTIPLLSGQNHHASQLSGEIFTYAFSCGAFRVLQDKGFQPDLLAGHSLGIYAALTAAGCISFNDGLSIICKAYQLGNRTGRQKNFGAIIIIGLEHEEISRALRADGYSSVRLGNLNNHSSGVYVGLREETDKLTRWAEAAGALKTIPLRTDIPYHNPLFMRESGALFSDFLETLHWNDPGCPIVSALDHGLVKTGAGARELTAANLSSPIHWPGVLQKLSEQGVDAVMECGLGVSLTQHSRFIDQAPYHYNLRNFRRRLDY